MARDIHDVWDEIHIHTAVCDWCEHHNKHILYRCQECGNSICTPCKNPDMGDDKHYFNDGGRGPPETSSAPLLLPTPPDASSAPSLHPDTAEPAQHRRQSTVPRRSRKRRRTVVEETDDDFDDDEEEIPNGSRKAKKRQKTQRSKTRTSKPKRRRGDASPATRPEKKRRTVKFEIGESSRQVIQRRQPERMTREATSPVSDIRRTFISMKANDSRPRRIFEILC